MLCFSSAFFPFPLLFLALLGVSLLPLVSSGFCRGTSQPPFALPLESSFALFLSLSILLTAIVELALS